MTTSDYLEQLQQDKQDLVDNLTEKGITGLTGDETFTELVPEVLNIPSGGGDLSDYFETSVASSGNKDWRELVKKIPQVSLPSTRTNLGSYFSACYFTTLDLSNWNVENVISYQYLFSSSSNLTSINLSGWNTTNVQYMYGMFSGCSSLTELDLSNFVTTNVININEMFSGCRKLVKLDIRNFEFSNITTYSNLFGNASSGVPNYCLIIVKNQTEKDWVTTNFSRLTNVQTIAEYEGSQS